MSLRTVGWRLSTGDRIARSLTIVHGSGRHVVTSLVALVLVATLGGYARPPVAAAATSPFTDIAATTFEQDIDWLFAKGITVGCTPTTYCPDRAVSRGEMASFLVRMFQLTAGWDIDAFTDDDGTTHEQDINRLAASGITVGCTETTFCPNAPVRRDEMASFLVRAIPLTAGAGDDYFRDDNGTTHEADIDRTAAAGITTGCGTWRYCPASSVTRGQMAGFLHRVEKPISPPPYPAPPIATLYVTTTGTDGGNPCLVKANPCRTIAYALSLVLDFDTISVGPGTFLEGGLVLKHDLTITGDPGGGTAIDASGDSARRVFDLSATRTVSIDHLKLTGGRAANGGAILNSGTLQLSHVEVAGNVSTAWGGGIRNEVGADLTLSDSTIHDNTATNGGGGVANSGTATIVRSAIVGNASAGWGGGLDVLLGSMSIADSRIVGNRARWGGGMAANSSAVVITGSTISGNTATGVGGGMYGDYGGTITISNSTIVGNSAAIGGGLGMETPGLTVTSSTISGNTAIDYGGGINTGEKTVFVNVVDRRQYLTDRTRCLWSAHDRTRQHRRDPGWPDPGRHPGPGRAEGQRRTHADDRAHEHRQEPGQGQRRSRDLRRRTGQRRGPTGPAAHAAVRHRGVRTPAVTGRNPIDDRVCAAAWAPFADQRVMDGSTTRPMNRMAPVSRSRSRNRNGWSSRSVNCFRALGPPPVSIPTAVAAAASVPFSSTSMFAWWMTFLM